MASPLPRPPYDPELAAVHGYFPQRGPLTKEQFLAWRKEPTELMLPTAEHVLSKRPLTHVEHRVPGFLPDDPEVTISVFTPAAGSTTASGPLPCLYFMHGGGLAIGDRFTGVYEALDWVTGADCVFVTVEYRLAPEHVQPALLHDCYAGLAWVHAHAAELGVDPARVMVGGHSGGACMAAGLAMMARDRRGGNGDGLPICAQLLASPMLDNRNESTSTRQYATEEPWLRASNATAWAAALGQEELQDGAQADAPVDGRFVPNRAADLAGLPPTWVDVGSADVFRDEAVEFASRIWAAGGQAELRVWSGCYHGFELIAPKARPSAEAVRGRNEWVKHIFGRKP
ncbi:hypothetical protein N3K66_002934 [Trichothecium roseum]|uniref:Uncharacterized protein n=1 Tax=Trichothecium roseum TaxID=47278 RepID=A0ACC0V6L3_9HYPO|nr:hypothetical protein N3K66_002934 [Trichothecium roseum]